MGAIKRIYIYIVSAVSLSIAAVSLLALLWNIFFTTGGAGFEEVSLTSAIIVSLPVYLGHWRWAQRLSAESHEELESDVRGIYLYVVIVVGVGTVLGALYGLLEFDIMAGEFDKFSWMYILTMIEAGVIWYYHHTVIKADSKALGREAAPLPRYFYWLFFTIVGASVFMSAGYQTLKFLFEYATSASLRLNPGIYEYYLLELIFGLTLWTVYWQKIQKKARDSVEELNSFVRRVYLYVVVFMMMASTVSVVTLLLRSGVRRLFDLPSTGELSEALAVLIMTAGFWYYHALVIREDDQAVEMTSKQSNVSRTYQYLVAFIGFSVFLSGLVGIVNLLIEGLGSSVMWNQANTLSTLVDAAMGIVVGIIAWMIPWRSLMVEVEDAGDDSANLRKIIVRQIYLYAFVLISALTILWGVISIISWLLSGLFGINYQFEAFIVADSLIAAGVLYFYGRILREDSRIVKGAIEKIAEALKVTVFDTGDGKLALDLREALQKNFKSLALTIVGLTPEAIEKAGFGADAEKVILNLAEADLVIGPWNMDNPTVSGDKISQAITECAAFKLLLPVEMDNMSLVGHGVMDDKNIVKETVRAVRGYLAGERVEEASGRSWGCWRIVGYIVAAWILLSLLANLFWYFS